MGKEVLTTVAAFVLAAHCMLVECAAVTSSTTSGAFLESGNGSSGCGYDAGENYEDVLEEHFGFCVGGGVERLSFELGFLIEEFCV